MLALHELEVLRVLRSSSTDIINDVRETVVLNAESYRWRSGLPPLTTALSPITSSGARQTDTTRRRHNGPLRLNVVREPGNKVC